MPQPDFGKPYEKIGFARFVYFITGHPKCRSRCDEHGTYHEGKWEENQRSPTEFTITDAEVLSE